LLKRLKRIILQSVMRLRHFKYWLVVMNLLAFNAYALSAVAAFSLPAPTQHASSAVQQNNVQDRACNEGMASSSHHKAHHCGMPCCKDRLKELAQANTCCKLGNSGSMQLQNIGSYNHIYLDVASYIDAKPATLILQDRTQRLLRPPIQ